MDVSPETVFEAVERLCSSNQFARSHRLARFLRFTISEALAGKQDTLTEHVIGIHVYDRPPDFDPKVDGIVRGEARRLRKKLAQYYAREGRADPVVVEFRAGSYAPIFHSRTPSALLDFLGGGGEMANLVRETDWVATPIGPIDRWSAGFRSTLSICLRASSPSMLFWGSELFTFFNDAALRRSNLLDARSLGKSAREALQSVWPRFGPVLETTRRNGSTVELPAQQAGLHQDATSAERFFNISFVPVSEKGEIAGVLVSEIDITQLVLAKRRQQTLWDLMTRSANAVDVSEACRFFASGLRDNPADFPFACIYSFAEDSRQAALDATVRIEPGTSLSPRIISIDRGRFFYEGLSVRTEVPQAFDLGPGFASLATDFPEASPVSIAMLPIYPFGTFGPAGMLITGLHPHQRFEGDYRNFLELVASQLSRAFSQAQARIREKHHLEEIAQARQRRIDFFEKAGSALRGPLTLLAAPLEEMSAADPAHTFEGRHRLQMVRQAGTQLVRLLDALQDYSTIETGMTDVHYEPIDLSMLTLPPAETFRSVIERAGIHYAVECPSMPEPAYIDAELWEKVVLNLLSNAFEHTLRGEIRISLSMIGDRFVLEVVDTGTGISEKERHRLFTPFGRIPCTGERSRRGLGMGLALSRAFLDLHGGSLEILSRSEHGSRVVASIPRGKDHLSPGRIGGKDRHPWSRLIARARLEEAEAWLADQSDAGQWVSRPIQEPSMKRVLVAEDSRDLREYLLALLSGAYTTETVADVEHAVASARTNPPDLVIAESSLPTDGGTLVQALRSQSATQSVPVILLTEDSAEEARLRALSAGADDFLLKPFSARELIFRAHSQIALSSRRKRST